METRESRNQHLLNKARELAAEFAQTYPLRDKRREFPYEEMSKLKASGLLAISVPKEYGGMDLPCRDIVESVMILAEGSPSVAQMFAVHCIIGTQVLCEFATEAQKSYLFREIVQNHAFLANAGAERYSKHAYAYEATFVPTQDNKGILITGKKFFSTGSLAADILLIGGVLNGNIALAVVPRKADGLVIHEDWQEQAMGQRGTASGTSELNNVFVEWNMVIPKLANEGKLSPSSFFGPVWTSCLSAIFVGAAKGALRCAIEYVKTKARPLPWPGSGVTTAVEDPYILQEVGKLQACVSAAESLVYRAARQVEEAMAARGQVSMEELARRRAAASVMVSQAKVMSTELGLRVCQDVFQVCGARAAMENLDRFWRDVRTLTLHDPVTYQARAIGEYLLQGKQPIPGFRY